jgi:alpha-tubulin suppressor-like RCC1 family protein
MTTLTNILVPSNILTASNTCTVTNKTINGANNTLTVRMANDVCGTLPVANGGSGQTTYTNGQLLIGNTTGNTLTKATITGGTDITITNSTGSITIDYVPPDVNLIYSWGENSCATLGDNTTTNRFSPVSVVGGFTNWCQVSAGDKHLLGVRTNGTLYAWGRNYCGKLGDNTTADKSSPVSVVGGFTDWCQVSGGYYHSLAVRQNGTAWGWGCNNCGQLGDNTTVAKSSPVSVIGGFTNWCQVSGGYRHSAGVRQSGTAWGWGNNTYGQLGNGTTENRSSPVSVVGGFTDWCQISAASKAIGRSTLAVRSTAT